MIPPTVSFVLMVPVILDWLIVSSAREEQTNPPTGATAVTVRSTEQLVIVVLSVYIPTREPKPLN